MSHPTYNSLKAAYSFYNVANTMSWVDLMGDALVLAKKVKGYADDLTKKLIYN